MNIKELNNSGLVDGYSELHRRLGERSLWIMRLEDEIHQTLASMVKAEGEKLRNLKSECVAKREQLFSHKKHAYDLVFWIYQMESEMDQRVLGSSNEQKN